MYKGIFFLTMALIIFPVKTYAQEIIWSTVENDVRGNGRQLSLNQVEEEIMTLYSNYRYYYDDTDYDIDYFLQAFGMNFMLAHLPKSAMAMKMVRNEYEQVQILIFVLYQQYRISGCIIFSDDGRGYGAIEANNNNEDGFKTLLNSLWFNIAGIDY
jgi:hypothetical protein